MKDSKKIFYCNKNKYVHLYTEKVNDNLFIDDETL